MGVGEKLADRPKRLLRSRSDLAPAAMLLFGIIAVALYATFNGPLLYPYVGDSASFIEAARSLLSGKPLLISVPFGYQNETQIFRLWPPGYPVLIAVVASAGIDAAEASLWLTRLFVALLPLAVYWAIHRAVPRSVAIAGALISGSALGILRDANFVTADAPFAVIVALSLGSLLRSLDENDSARSFRLLILTGILTALAITIRNSGIALALAEGATLASLWITKEASFVRTLRRGVGLAIGAGLGLVPLLTWNLVVLGQLRPYGMPPSTVGVAQNVSDLMNALVYDLLPVMLLRGQAAPILATLLVVSASVIGLIAVRRLRAQLRVGEAAGELSEFRRRAAFLTFSVSYSLISATMLVAARSRYEWGELISERHVAQFDWLLVTSVLTAITGLIPARRAATAALVAVVASTIALRCWYFVGVHQDYVEARDAGQPVASTAALAFSKSTAAAHLVRSIPDHCDIIGNAALVIQATYQRRSRMVWNAAFKMEDFANLSKPSVLIFVPTPKLDIQILQPPGPGYRTIRDPVFVAFQPEACRTASR